MDTLFPRQPSEDRGQMPLAVTGPACCCPAMPVVRVVLPPTQARPHPTDLLLCGHHYRVSRQRLAALNATVQKLPGISGDGVALFEDVPSSQAAPVR
jgi:hypothetical protein